jgi:hypothetical protein
MTDDLKAKYADRIAGLLRKAESTDHPAEAETFFTKAAELMAKYAIDEAFLAQREGRKSDDNYAEEEFVTIGIYRHALYWIDVYCLWAAGCELYEITRAGERVLDGRTYKQTRVVVGCGWKSDLDRARMLATSLKLQAMRAESSWWDANEYRYEWDSTGNQHAARRGFMLAFAQGANTIMQKAEDKAKKEAEADQDTDSTGVALVLANKSEMVKYEFRKRHSDLRSGRSSRMNDGGYEARAAGYAEGKKADVGRPAAGSGRKSLGK